MISGGFGIISHCQFDCSVQGLVGHTLVLGERRRERVTGYAPDAAECTRWFACSPFEKVFFFCQKKYLSMEPTNPSDARSALAWDDYFFAVAHVSAARSKDPSRQVGCCIVDTSKRIVAIGYNGFPRGCADDAFPWSKTGDKWRDTKYPYVCHAEANAILNHSSCVANGTLYTTLFPCHECAKLIIQSGIRAVKYLDSKDDDSAAAAMRMFSASGVETDRVIPTQTVVLVPYTSHD